MKLMLNTLRLLIFRTLLLLTKIPGFREAAHNLLASFAIRELHRQGLTPELEPIETPKERALRERKSAEVRQAKKLRRKKAKAARRSRRSRKANRPKRKRSTK